MRFPDAGYFRFLYRCITGYRTDTPLLELRGLNIYSRRWL